MRFTATLAARRTIKRPPFHSGGKILDRIEGAKVADMTKKVKELGDKVALKARTSSTGGGAEKKAASEPDFKALISAAPAMLFMKGSPDAPECKFSRATVELLGSINAEYGHFDILRDDAVRQGLKTFSNWPTYPQFYVKGELVGGLDILKEMHENGELEPMVPKKQNLEDRLKFLTSQVESYYELLYKDDTFNCSFDFSIQSRYL